MQRPSSWRVPGITLPSGRTWRRGVNFARRSWSALLVAALVIGVAIAAVVTPGIKVSDTHLDDSAVYVAKASAALLGSLNTQVDELSAATPVSDQFEIFQDGTTVLVHSLKSNQLAAYDPGRNSVASPVNLPRNSMVSVGAGVIAVTSRDNGRVWYGSIDEMLKRNFSTAKADLDLGQSGMAIVTATGHVIGLSAVESALVRPTGANTTSKTQLLWPLTADDAPVSMSAVGDTAVLLNTRLQQVWIEGDKRTTDISGAPSAKLLPPVAQVLGGDGGVRAAFANSAGLVGLTKDGTKLLSAQMSGTPVTPVQVGDCVYGVYGNQFSTSCRGQEPTSRAIPELPANANLVFRVNRGSVVLNDTLSGYIWLVQEDMKLIKDWSKVTPSSTQGATQTDQTLKITKQMRKQEHPPIAVEDHLYARAGRSTALRVLDNDTDPDGDLLTIMGPPTVKGGTLQLTGGGSGLQITVPSNASGALSFTYTVSDGRGGTASAKVTVTVVSPDPTVFDQAPKLQHANDNLAISLGSTATKRVLLDWRDPEGDDLILTKAEYRNSAGDEVTFTPDGTLTFTDVGKVPGTKEVKVTVSDGVKSQTGVVRVVVSKDAATPKVNGDFYTTNTGTDLVVTPLANDEGTNLALTQIESDNPSPDVSLTPKLADNRAIFRASRPGTYYLIYTAASGSVAQGLVRIDVSDPTSNSGRAPVAVRDVVLLPAGGNATFDPLVNDSDPDGNVLVVQSFEQDPALSIVMQDRHILTVSARRFPSKPIALTYLISNGREQAQGTFVVVPVPPVSRPYPQAQADTVRVRAGQVGAVDVLRNDTSPAGLDLKVVGFSVDPAPGSTATGKVAKVVPAYQWAWIENGMVNFAVPATAAGGSTTYNYVVEDSNGYQSSAPITLNVTSQDAASEPPQPRTVEERVLAGTTTRIPIPLDGIDPDGDAVTLLGIGSGPGHGRVTAIGDGYLSYEAFPESSGTDTFQYRVVDAGGLVGVGLIRIGIAPIVFSNSRPTVGSDEITVRPGVPVRMDLLSNDYDIEGDTIGFASTSPLHLPFPAQVVKGTPDISFTAPNTPGDYPGYYTVRDARDSTASGTLVVHVSTKAPGLPPTAVDDIVPVSEVLGKDWVEIDVLKNDFDRDGATSHLSLSLPDANSGVQASVEPNSNKLRVRVTDHYQTLRYRVTDADGQSADATVIVPGHLDDVPHLKDPALRSHPVEVVAGATLPLPLSQYVSGSNGQSVKLTSQNKVVSPNGSGVGHPDRVDYIANANYAGPDAVVFEVADDLPAGNKAAKTAYITIPITVKPRPDNKQGASNVGAHKINHPPQGGSPVLEIAPGEPPESLNLQAVFRDPEGESFRFDNWTVVSTSGSGINWTHSDDGSTISASAPVSAKVGSQTVLGSVVTDASGEKDPKVRVTIKVINSTRPAPIAVTDVVSDMNAGESRTIDVLSNDKSNLPNDKILTLVDAPQVISGSGTARYQGSQVVVTPSANFVGTLTVRYTIVDATKDPNRQVDGTIQATVRSKPGAPGVPVEQSSGDQTAVVKFSPAEPNGLSIDYYQLTATAPGGQTVTQQCGSNTCTVSGLTNDRNYTMTVTAHNQLGMGPASGSSAAIRPDVRPDKPAGPTLQFGNGQLTVKWAAPTNRGSAITQYKITMMSPQRQEQVVPVGTSYTWKGLTNGTSYTFAVSATNKKGWSDLSPNSSPEHPTGPPDPPTNLNGKDHGSDTGGWIDITWDAPAIGVDEVSCFDIYSNQSSTTPIATCVTNGYQKASDGRQQSYLWKGAKNGVAYTFTIKSKNRLGYGAASAASPVVTAFGAPGAPTNVKFTVGDGSVTLADVDDTSNGKPIDYWKVTLTAGNEVKSANLKKGESITGLTDGTNYQATIVAVSGTKQSDSASAGSVTPYGPLGLVPYSLPGRASDNQTRYVIIRAYTDANANGHDPNNIQYWVDSGQGWTQVNPDEYIAVPTGGTSKTIQLRATDPALQDSSGTNSVRSLTLEPPLTASVNGSHQIVATLNKWDPGYYVHCQASTNGWKSQVQDDTNVTSQDQIVFPDMPGDPNASPAPTATAVEVSCWEFDSQGHGYVTSKATTQWP